MISLGAVCIEDPSQTFYVQIDQLSGSKVDPKAYAVAIKGWDHSLPLHSPKLAMIEFDRWVTKVSHGEQPRFISDNAGFDWGFVNYYFHAYVGNNPFGHSPVSLTWFAKGLRKNLRYSFKKLRKTKHTHNALDDARGNAEAWITLVKELDS